MREPFAHTPVSSPEISRNFLRSGERAPGPIVSPSNSFVGFLLFLSHTHGHTRYELETLRKFPCTPKGIVSHHMGARNPSMRRLLNEQGARNKPSLQTQCRTS
eukprot:1952604-Amphidinium_carterae.1